MISEKSSSYLHGGLSTSAEIQKEYYIKGKIYTLQIESTMKCLQGCSYCYANSTPDREAGLSSMIIKAVLDDAAEIGVKCIDWLGGDPLEREDWYPLVKYSQNLGLVNNIWTSGLLLADKDVSTKAVEVTQNSGFISTHLDSLNPEIYKLVHNYNTQEYIKQILKGIENVLSLGKSPLEMWNCITLTKQVALDSKNTMKWFWDKKKIRTVLTLFNPVNRNLLDKNFIPSNKMIHQAYEWRDEINYSDSDLSFSTMDTNKFYCATMITLTSDGYFTPCSVIRRKDYGNISKISLKEIANNNPGDILFLSFRDMSNLPDKCQNCENNKVCFGCRSSAYHYSGNVFAEDPVCSKNFIEMLNVE